MAVGFEIVWALPITSHYSSIDVGILSSLHEVASVYAKIFLKIALETLPKMAFSWRIAISPRNPDQAAQALVSNTTHPLRRNGAPGLFPS
jgi:hypothetical protein